MCLKRHASKLCTLREKERNSVKDYTLEKEKVNLSLQSSYFVPSDPDVNRRHCFIWFGLQSVKTARNLESKPFCSLMIFRVRGKEKITPKTKSSRDLIYIRYTAKHFVGKRKEKLLCQLCGTLPIISLIHYRITKECRTLFWKQGGGESPH